MSPPKHTSVLTLPLALVVFCFCSLERGPSYLLLAPSSLQPGLQTSISVTVLSSSPVLVSADITHGNQTLTANSTTVRGGQSFSMSPPGYKWLQ